MQDGTAWFLDARLAGGHRTLTTFVRPAFAWCLDLGVQLTLTAASPRLPS